MEKKTPRDKVTDFIKNQVKKEKNKWSIGMKSEYIAWISYLDTDEARILLGDNIKEIDK